MLKEYDSVRLKRPLSNDAVPVRSDGVVLIVYTEPTFGYEVEFFDDSHRSLGSFTTTEDDLEKRTDSVLQVEVADYVCLMKDFLDNLIDVHQYRRSYFGFALMRMGVLSDEEDKIIQQAYGDADDFDDAVQLEYTIDEGQLRQRVSASLKKLKTLGHAIADQ
jgi:Domain of unknown function (DUF4926)/Bacterial self-protective colicin-like immunity